MLVFLCSCVQNLFDCFVVGAVSDNLLTGDCIDQWKTTVTVSVFNLEIFAIERGEYVQFSYSFHPSETGKLVPAAVDCVTSSRTTICVALRRRCRQLSTLSGETRRKCMFCGHRCPRRPRDCEHVRIHEAIQSKVALCNWRNSD